MENLNDFFLKCNELLSHFKKKQRDDFVKYGHTYYDDHVSRLLSLTSKIEDEMRYLDSDKDIKLIDDLYNQYTEHENVTSEIRQQLLDSLRQEHENNDKETWYKNNFDNWINMPERHNSEDYSIVQKLQYSKCRLKIFEGLENSWKEQTFPTIHKRLEFF